MASLVRLIIVLLGALLVLVASGAKGYPYPAVDIPLMFVGFAVSVHLHWEGRWTKQLLVQAFAEAFFFRCLALAFLGNDAVRLMALRDAGLGLMAVGARSYVIHRQMLQTAEAGADDPMPLAASLGTNGSDVEDRDTTYGAAQPDETKPSDVKPIQFSLQGMLFATTFVAALASLAVKLGVQVAVGVVVLGTFWWLLACCARIIKTGDRTT